MKTNHVQMSITYAGLSLQVIKHEGRDYVPLKPISDLFGLRWDRQREKLVKSAYLRRFLGFCTPVYGGASCQKQEENCILLSRVAAFLMSLSPGQIRSHGNVDGADFLEEKINEWADALHDYEELGVALNVNHAKVQAELRKQRTAFAQMIAAKSKAQDIIERKALGSVIGQMAEELGAPYQQDLIDGS